MTDACDHAGSTHWIVMEEEIRIEQTGLHCIDGQKAGRVDGLSTQKGRQEALALNRSQRRARTFRKNLALAMSDSLEKDTCLTILGGGFRMDQGHDLRRRSPGQATPAEGCLNHLRRLALARSA
jgi:hypothetical protein